MLKSLFFQHFKNKDFYMSVKLPQLNIDCWTNVFYFFNGKENERVTRTCKDFKNIIAKILQNNIKRMVLKSELSFGSVVNLTKKYGKILTKLDFEERTYIDIKRLKELTICDQVKEINLASYKGLDTITVFEQILTILKDFKKVETLTLNDICESYLLTKSTDEYKQITKLKNEILSDSCQKLIEKNLKGRKFKIKFGGYEIDTSNKKEGCFSYTLTLPVGKKVCETMKTISLSKCIYLHDYSTQTQPSLGKFSEDFNKHFNTKHFSICSGFEDSTEYTDFFKNSKGSEIVTLKPWSGDRGRSVEVLNSKFCETLQDLRLIFEPMMKEDYSKFFKTNVFQKIKTLSIDFCERSPNLFQDKFLEGLIDDLANNICSLNDEYPLNKLETMHLRFHYWYAAAKQMSSKPLSSVTYLENEGCSKLKELSKKISSFHITLTYSYEYYSSFDLFSLYPKFFSKTIYTGNFEDNKNKYIDTGKVKTIRQ